MDRNYAFIGLGVMGYPMAANIRRKTPSSSTLYIYDIHLPSCERFLTEFSSHGPIEIVSSPKEAASKSQVLVSIVPGAKDVEKVYLDPVDGVIAASSSAAVNDDGKERLMLECSTIDSATTRKVGIKLAEAGQGRYVDTPVSGGQPAAAAGTLSFMIGATEEIIPSNGSDSSSDSSANRLHTVISMMGDPKKFFYCGGLGNGLAAKISNNYLAGTILLATAEALAIGIHSGIDKHVLYQVIRHSTGQSWMCDHVHPVPGVVPHVPSSHDYTPGFKTQMMIKDIQLGIDAGLETEIEPTMAKAAMEVWKKAAVDPLCRDRDGSSVYLYLQRLEKKD